MALPTWLTGHGYDSRGVNAGGLSADQIVARHLRDQTLLPSLEMSTKGEGYFYKFVDRETLISWSAPRSPEWLERSNLELFLTGCSARKDSVNSNRSVMDSVLADARSLANVVSAADSLRLDEYFESIRALERRIEFAERQSTEMLNDRALTDTLVAPTPGIPANHESYVRLMMDLMILAFQSDATRVITFMLDHGQSNRYLISYLK